MIEPLRLSIVLCAEDTSVEEDKQDDEPEHGLGNKEYKYDHDVVDDNENHDDDYEGADEDKQDDDPEHELDNNQDEN